MSTSSQTIHGSLPPNSRVTRFNVLAQLVMTRLPVAIDPVKEILSMPGCSVIIGPRLSSPLRHCTTPGGKNRVASSASFRSQYGVNGEGFTMTVFPVYTAGTIFPTAKSTGKFHGTIAPATPIGVYLWMILRSSVSSMVCVGISMPVSPRTHVIAMPTSTVDWDRGLPCSMVRVLENPSALASIASAYAWSAARRSSKEVFDHVLNAARAAWTALSRSSCVATGTSGLGSVVAGLLLWRVTEVEVNSLFMTLWNVCATDS